MLDSIKRTYDIIKNYLSKSTFRKMVFMLFSRSLIICGIGTISVPALFMFLYNNSIKNNEMMFWGGIFVFMIYVIWLIWADKKQLISYNRLFFLSEMAMQKDYIFKLVHMPVDVFGKNFGVSKSATLMDDGTDEVMMRFQDFVSLVFKSIAVICVTVWISYISNVFVVCFIFGVIILEFIVSDKISKKIGKLEDNEFQNMVRFENAQRIFSDSTDIYAMAGLDQYWHTCMDDLLKSVYRAKKTVLKSQNILSVLMGGLDLSVYMIVILYGVYEQKGMLSPLVIIMAYEMIKDIVIDYLNSIMRIQQKIYIIREFEEIKLNTVMKENSECDDIRLKDVSLTVGEKKLLDNVSLNIQKGGKVLLIGDNGAGKTLLLKILSGIYTKDMSEMSITGEVEVPKAAFGPVERNFFPVSLYENINMCCENDIARKDIENRLSLLMNQQFDVDEVCGDYSNHFSLGQLDVFSFFRTIYSDKDFIVLDEPFAHVNRELKEKLWKTLMKTEKTVVIVEHDYMDVVKKYNPMVMWIKNGCLVSSGKYNELYCNTDFRAWVTQER